MERNIFKTTCGVLKKAPHKISGQYKLVIKESGDIYFDDYTGRRVLFDKTKPFLYQLSNFLEVKSTIDNYNKLNYGAFQNSTQKSFHIPFYFQNDSVFEWPDFFVLTQIPNENITDCNFLFEYSNILKIVDLNKVGLFDIFNEIEKEILFNYPIYSNIADKELQIYGYNITTLAPTYKKIDTTQIQANQNYFDVVNNKILNYFVNNNMIYPRFINLEFEFEYINNYTVFNNFFGYLAKANNINEVVDNTIHNIKYRETEKSDGIVNIFESLTTNSTFTLDTYEILDTTIFINDINQQNPIYRVKLFNINIDDNISIYEDTEQIFTYTIKAEDIIYESFVQTITGICNKMNKLAGNLINFTYNIITSTEIDLRIELTYYDDYSKYSINIPTNYKTLDRIEYADNYFEFRAIEKTDVWLSYNINYSNIKKLTIDNIDYLINEVFYYDGYLIFRLDKSANLTKQTIADIYTTKKENLISLNKIPYLVNPEILESFLPYNKSKYINDLIEKFDSTSLEFDSAIEDFKNVQTLDIYYSLFLYTNYDDIINVNKLALTTTDDNQDYIKNMLFFNGSTTYLEPNFLNFERAFYKENGCINFDYKDNLRFNWFLIKGETPEYIKNNPKNLNNLRYFVDKPQFVSTLHNIDNNFSETIFLGVKYQLPLQYQNYQFATYIDFNNLMEPELFYEFEIDDLNKTIYLKVSKYLDYNDLLRGGNVDNEPLLDLSFFYSVNKSYNLSSPNLTLYNTSNILLGQNLKVGEILKFNGEIVNDWFHPHNGNYYLALRRDLNNNINNRKFTEIFPSSGDSEFYIYSDVDYNGRNYQYISMIITIKNIQQLTDDYLWCDDVDIKFFDTKDLFVSIYQNIPEEILFIEDYKNLISSTNPESNNFYGDIILETKFNNISESLNLLLPSDNFSFKKYYFRINHYEHENIWYRNIFKFNEFMNKGLTDDELIELFDSNKLSNLNGEYQITLFDRNQIWYMIQSLFMFDLKFKYQSETEIKRNINEFTIEQLQIVSDYSNISIKNRNDSINLKIIPVNNLIVNWDDVLNLSYIKRYSGNYENYFDDLNDEIEFQNSNSKIKLTKINNLYSDDYNCFNWQEIQGNVVSTLFCEDLEYSLSQSINTTNTEIEINYKDLFMNVTSFESILIPNKEILTTDEQLQISNYIDYLMINFYKIDSVKNELGEKLEYSYSTKKPNTLTIKQLNSFYTFFNQIIITFKRR